MTVKVLVAVPCHEDEPAVGDTVMMLAEQSATLAARIVVCVNGPTPEGSVADAALRAIDAASTQVAVVYVARASKPAAWTRLRREPADVTVFCDADVELEPGSVAALVGALDDPDVALAAAVQRPRAASGLAARAASAPFRLEWAGVAGTLYAARTEDLPGEMPEGILLDDAWVYAKVGGRVRAVAEAVAWFRPPTSWRDLWQQRLRAEAGKRQLAELGLSLAPAPRDLTPTGVLRVYPAAEWPAVGALAALKAAAALWSRVRPPAWGTAPSTKRP